MSRTLRGPPRPDGEEKAPEITACSRAALSGTMVETASARFEADAGRTALRSAVYCARERNLN